MVCNLIRWIVFKWLWYFIQSEIVIGCKVSLLNPLEIGPPYVSKGKSKRIPTWLVFVSNAPKNSISTYPPYVFSLSKLTFSTWSLNPSNAWVLNFPRAIDRRLYSEQSEHSFMDHKSFCPQYFSSNWNSLVEELSCATFQLSGRLITVSWVAYIFEYSRGYAERRKSRIR